MDEGLYKFESVLMMHGQNQDAQTWLLDYFVGLPLPLQLANNGYTVYMGNSRGTKYSSVNTNVADQTSEAYWDFDFTDMGTKDVPAFLHTIFTLNNFHWNNDTAGVEWNMTHFIGYDTGNMQYFYALTQFSDTFLSQVDHFLAYAPCVYKDISNGLTNVTFAQGVGLYRSLGVYAVNGPNWETDLV